MKRCLLRCLKAGLIVMWFFSTPMWAANTGSIGANKADIEFTSVINGDNHMDVVISSGSPPGCPSGQYWDIVMGGCTSAITLRTETTIRACSCTCPGEGSCTSSQSGTYPVFGWRLPTAGNELISGYGATSWGACKVVSNACLAETAPPAGEKPPPGTVFIFESFICNSSHPDYYNGPLGDYEKGQIISAYRQFNAGSRCPELSGYVYWQNSWLGWAQDWLTKNPSSNIAIALQAQWFVPTKDAMDRAASENGEGKDSYISVLNAECKAYALRKYGMEVDASYINHSGSSCIVN